VEIDARTSDAIAVAVRFNCPISTYEFILSTAGILLEDDNIENLDADNEDDKKDASIEIGESTVDESNIQNISTDRLSELLEAAISNEDYERASKIRDELTSRQSNN
jgi:bifunctional DNase/RNase